MKKLVSFALAVLMILSLCACGAKEEPAAAPAAAPAAEAAPAEEAPAYLSQLVADGKLTVATSPDFAPYEFYAIDADGEPQLAGFDIALAGFIADYLGLELEIIPMDFDGVLAELAAGTVDLGLAGLSPDPNRMDAMDFSDLYYLGGQSFCCSKATAEKFTDLASVNNASYSIAAQTGSIQMDLANKFAADADIIALTKVTDIVAELVAGKLDGAFIETAVAQTYAINYPDLVIVCSVPYEEAAGSAIGVKKGQDALLAAVNEAIAAALADGSMDAFVAAANELAAGETYEGLLENK